MVTLTSINSPEFSYGLRVSAVDFKVDKIVEITYHETDSEGNER